MTEEGEVLAAGECVGSDKPAKRKVRKANSPKPTRGRSPVPGKGGGGGDEGKGSSHPASPKKSGGVKKKGHIPKNPSRGGSNGSPSGGGAEADGSNHAAKDNKDRSTHTKKERSARKLSPKRGNSKDGNLEHKPPKDQVRSRSKSPKRIDSANDRPASPPSAKRNNNSNKNGARGRSPDGKKIKSSSSDRGDKTNGEQEKSGRKTRSTSPRRDEGGGDPGSPRQGNKKKPGPSKKKKQENKTNNKKNKDQTSPTTPPPEEPSINLLEGDNEDDDDAAQSESGSEATPRYVSPKGNTTHLQLDLSHVGSAGADMPVFSLLDENSLLGGASTDDDEGSRNRSNSPKRRPKSHGVDAHQRDSLLDSVNTKKREQQQQRASAVSPAGTPTTELKFTPWEFNGDDGKDEGHKEDDKKKKGFLGGGLGFGGGGGGGGGFHAPKGSTSPVGNMGKRAIKALKYTPNMAGASQLMGRLNKGIQQRMGLTDKHHHMDDEDDDDLDGLLS